MDQVLPLAPETELSEDLGIADGEGLHQVVLMSAQQRDSLLQPQQRLEQGGYAMEIVPVEISGTQYFRLLSAGFTTLVSARNAAQRITQAFELQDSWINRID